MKTDFFLKNISFEKNFFQKRLKINKKIYQFSKNPPRGGH